MIVSEGRGAGKSTTIGAILKQNVWKKGYTRIG
jgi:hypothetical protein